MGVITETALPGGRVYGPIPPNITLTDPMLMIGHMTTDSRPDVHTVKVNIEAYACGSRLGEWVPYVQAAREEREQNLEAFIKDGQLYYRVRDSIKEGSELMVWYSADLAQIIGVPELRHTYIKDGVFSCPYCHAHFRFPYCLRAHMRFKCESSRHIYSTCTTSRATTQLSLTRPGTEPQPPRLNLPIFSPATMGLPMSLLSHQQRMSSSPPDSRAPREERLSEGGISPGSTSSGVSSASFSPPTSAEKRKHEDDDDAIASSKRFLSQDFRPRSPISANLNNNISKSPSPSNNNNNTIDDSGSAFRKVERSMNKPSPPLPSPASFRPPSQLPPSHYAASLAMLRPFHHHPQPAPQGLPSMAALYKENIPVSLADITRLANNLPVRARLPEIQAIQNGGKIPFHPDWRFHFPYYKSQNPIVETILQSAASGAPPGAPPTYNLNLMQNWCAKCNATFRMTSDLVYHMRSHHKKEFELEVQAAKPECKLECSFCGERFKERHHLTRHMTAHQEAKAI